MERFWKDLDGESDRGMVLVAGCYFDDLLKDCLVSYFVETKEAVRLLDELGGLASFSARNRCCLALRIINQEEFQTLKLLARVRNRFAHNLRADFTALCTRQIVVEMAHALQMDAEVLSELTQKPTREIFSFTAFCLNDALWLRPYDTKLHVAKYPDIVPEHVHLPAAGSGP
ncbi:MAG: hypothetical protein AAGM21_00660 [Pseudomonadota bacterium]